VANHCYAAEELPTTRQFQDGLNLLVRKAPGVEGGTRHLEFSDAFELRNGRYEPKWLDE
jgi:hypothetical protein